MYTLRIHTSLKFLFIAALVAACSACTNIHYEPPAAMAEYDLGFGSNGPVHTKELTLINDKENLYTSGGGFSGGGPWKPGVPNSMPVGSGFHALVGKKIIPEKAYARWFSYPNQKFYEAEIIFTKNLPELFTEYKAAFGKNTYKPTIVFGFGQNGEIKAALSTSCSYIYKCGKNEKKSIVASGIGRETTGDPKVYLPITRQLIREGRIAPIPGTEE